MALILINLGLLYSTQYTMKNIQIILLFFTCSFFSFAQNDSDLSFSQLDKSPLDVVMYRDANKAAVARVIYSRPSKRDREIFGNLVPYDQVWRTGANEATTFETNKALKIGNDSLPKGKYTLWTIPNDTAWSVMINAKQYKWGVDETMQPMRIPDFDVITYSAPVQHLNKPVEQFTIAFDNSTDNLSLTMAWDVVKIVVPLK